jgi:DNA repair photolyase
LAAVRRLADAGIRVGVAVAPVIPGLTDRPEMLADVMRAVAAAGASFAWHGVLNLGAVTRDAFFSYLEERQPELIARYRAMYRTKYPPAGYVRETAARFAAAARAVPLAPPPVITATPPPAELQLFG